MRHDEKQKELDIIKECWINKKWISAQGGD